MTAMTLHNEIELYGDNAQLASRELAQLPAKQKNAILHAMSASLHRQRAIIREANQQDMEAAKTMGLSGALLDRLELTDDRIDAMTQGLIQVSHLPDPVGEIIRETIRPNGLRIQKIRTPIGVIGIIYESRPNVTVDVAALCLKTGNAIILRGGREAIHSNRALVEAMFMGGIEVGLPQHAIQLIVSTDHAAVKEMVQLEGKVNLIIPRGGEKLIRAVVENARVPVIKHYKGICHTYVDDEADLEMALAISENAKCQRPGVCNAMETLLVHEKIAPAFIPAIVKCLQKKGVELRGDEKARQISPILKNATSEDWETEYLDLILAIKIVQNIEEAINHINQHGSHHSDAIVSNDKENQQRFVAEVDSATVYINASTRFTDGAEFGMGAEIGISTDKLHARGPMGLEELTTYKYIITGTGQIRP